MKLSIIIPMYNESAVIAESAAVLSAFAEKNYGKDCEVLLVDDGSTDGCRGIAESLDLPCLRVIGYEKNRGKGYAVRTGMLEAKGDFRIFTDSDLAYGVEVIKRAEEIYSSDRSVDIVLGSRHIEKSGYDGYTFVRRAASNAYLLMLRVLGGLKYSDSQSGFKGFSASAAERIFPLCETERFSFDFEVLSYAARMNMKVKEMPIKIINHGASKIRVLRDSAKMFGDILKIRRRVDAKMKELKKVEENRTDA